MGLEETAGDVFGCVYDAYVRVEVVGVDEVGGVLAIFGVWEIVDVDVFGAVGDVNVVVDVGGVLAIFGVLDVAVLGVCGDVNVGVDVFVGTMLDVARE